MPRLKDPKAKGNRNEAKVKRFLMGDGYHVIRAAGSLGVWDLVGIHKTTEEVILVQVKSNRMPGKAERRVLESFEIAKSVIKAIVVIPDRKPMQWYYL